MNAKEKLQAIVDELAPIASLGADDDGMETAEYYASSHVDYKKSVHENVEFISQIISEDQ